MADNRDIEKTLFEKFCDSKGIFFPFYQFTKNHLDQLAICFRGNGNPAEITIYHNNHKVWSLAEIEDDNIISVSFNHARYCEDWEEKLKAFGKLGFNIKNNNGEILSPKDADTIGEIKCSTSCKKYQEDSKSFVIMSYNLIMDMMNSFFEPKNDEDMDYFKGTMTRSKHNYAEKRWQQWIFNKFKYTHNGLFTYDLEFSQPGGNSKDETNEPDMLAIRYKNGEPVAIVLVEVKTRADACKPRNNKNGKRGSDIYEHLKGMRNYCQSENIKNRRIEAHDILEHYRKLGIYVKENQVIPSKNNELPVECLLIFTTADLIDVGHGIDSSESAIHYYYNNKSEVDNACSPIDSDWKCDILMIGDFVGNRKYPSAFYSLPADWC